MGEENKFDDLKLMMSLDDGETWIEAPIMSSPVFITNNPKVEEEAERALSLVREPVEVRVDAKVNRKMQRMITGTEFNNELRMAHRPMRKRRVKLDNYRKRIQKAIRKHMPVPGYKFPWWVDREEVRNDRKR